MATNKVYCKNCKYFDENEYGNHYCYFPVLTKVQKTDTYLQPEYEGYITQYPIVPYSENKNNDCKHYKNSTMFLIRSFFSKIFAR